MSTTRPDPGGPEWRMREELMHSSPLPPRPSAASGLRIGTRVVRPATATRPAREWTVYGLARGSVYLCAPYPHASHVETIEARPGDVATWEIVRP